MYNLPFSEIYKKAYGIFLSIIFILIGILFGSLYSTVISNTNCLLAHPPFPKDLLFIFSISVFVKFFPSNTGLLEFKAELEESMKLNYCS